MFIEEIDLTTFRNLAIALFIGGLVGLERERKHGGELWNLGGLRTFSLIGTAGGAAGWLAMVTGSTAPFLLVGVGVSALVVASYVVTSSRTAHGATTTEVAALSVYVLGAMSGWGHPGVAVPLAIVTAALLAFEDPLHRVVARVGPDDLSATLSLLFATFIVLPLLPQLPVDPWGVINLYTLWSLVVLISAISLVGYVAVRWQGPERGTALTGLFAGLVSSTAATLAFARRSHEHPQLAGPLTVGVLLAWAVMFVRVIVETAVVNVAILVPVLVPMAAMGVAACAVAGWAAWRTARGSDSDTEVPLQNPFRIWAAIQFAILYAVVLLVVALARRYLPDEALYAIAAIAGTTDVNAITLSMAAAARDAADPSVNVRAIVIAALSNTLVKLGIIVALGDPSLRRRVALGTVLIVLVGAAALVAQASAGGG